MSTPEMIQKRQQLSQITEGVWMWSAPYNDGEAFFNSFLIQTGKQEAVLVDPLFHALEEKKPLMSWSVFEDLPRPKAIWLTSSDHERDSELFCKQFDIPILAAKAEERWMACRVDQAIEDGDTLQGGWQAILLEDQKTPAEFAFYNPRQQLLNIGDAILTQEDGRLRRPYDEPSYKNEKKAQQGLQRLADLPVKGILVGHGDPVFQRAKALLKDALEKEPRSIARQ
jgi:glyoxylase-like metal-dependent hydrolase (beta-lactamase superfamily II)